MPLAGFWEVPLATGLILGGMREKRFGQSMVMLDEKWWLLPTCPTRSFLPGIDRALALLPTALATCSATASSFRAVGEPAYRPLPEPIAVTPDNDWRQNRA